MDSSAASSLYPSRTPSFIKNDNTVIHNSISSTAFTALTNAANLQQQQGTASISRNGSNSDSHNNIYMKRKAKYVVILMGLPATGKSTIAKQLIEYLGRNPLTNKLRCQVYNAGNVRRRTLSPTDTSYITSAELNDNVFAPKNRLKKENFARITLHNLLDDIDADACDFAIFDATNSTTLRRHYVLSQLSSYNLNPYSNYIISPVVLEIKCNDSNFIKFNIHNKSFNNDYFDKPYDFAVSDFSERLKIYRDQYSPFMKEEFEEYIESTTKVRSLYTPPDEKFNVYHGCAYFSIVNLGLNNDHSKNLKHFYKKCPNENKILMNLIEFFTDDYLNLFGKEYVKNVENFFKNDNKDEKNEKLTILHDIINQNYLDAILT